MKELIEKKLEELRKFTDEPYFMSELKTFFSSALKEIYHEGNKDGFMEGNKVTEETFERLNKNTYKKAIEDCVEICDKEIELSGNSSRIEAYEYIKQQLLKLGDK